MATKQLQKTPTKPCFRQPMGKFYQILLSVVRACAAHWHMVSYLLQYAFSGKQIQYCIKHNTCGINHRINLHVFVGSMVVGAVRAEKHRGNF